jgi:hypothetical protein
MKNIKNLGTKALAGLAGLALLAFTGCQKENATQPVPVVVTNTLEGKIVDVQDGSVTFAQGWTLNYKYLTFIDKEGKSRLLIYPISQGFIKGADVSIAYKPSEDGYVDFKKIARIHGFQIYRDYRFKADGLVVLGSVTYHTNSAPVMPEAPVHTSIFNNL